MQCLVGIIEHEVGTKNNNQSKDKVYRLFILHIKLRNQPEVIDIENDSDNECIYIKTPGYEIIISGVSADNDLW